MHPRGATGCKQPKPLPRPPSRLDGEIDAGRKHDKLRDVVIAETAYPDWRVDCR
jgi:hypothetical protein